MTQRNKTIFAEIQTAFADYDTLSHDLAWIQLTTDPRLPAQISGVQHVLVVEDQDVICAHARPPALPIDASGQNIAAPRGVVLVDL